MLQRNPVMPLLVKKDAELPATTSSPIPFPPPVSTAERLPVRDSVEPSLAGPEIGKRLGKRTGLGLAQESEPPMAVSVSAGSFGGAQRWGLPLGASEEPLRADVFPEVFQTESEDQKQHRRAALAAESDLTAAYFGQLNATGNAQQRDLGGAAQFLVRSHPKYLEASQGAPIMAQNLMSYAVHDGGGGFVGPGPLPPEVQFWQGNLEPSSMRVNGTFPRYASALDDSATYNAHAEDMLPSSVRMQAVRHFPFHPCASQEHPQSAARLGSNGETEQHAANSGWLTHDWSFGSVDHPINMADTVSPSQSVSWSETAAFSPWVLCTTPFDTGSASQKIDIWHDALPPDQPQICSAGSETLAGSRLELSMESALELPRGMLLDTGDIGICPLDDYPVEGSSSVPWHAVKGGGGTAGSETAPLAVVKSEVTDLESEKGRQEGSEGGEEDGSGRKRTWKDGRVEGEGGRVDREKAEAGEKRLRRRERQGVSSGESEAERVAEMRVDKSQGADQGQAEKPDAGDRSPGHIGRDASFVDTLLAPLRRSPSLLSRTSSMSAADQLAMEATAGNLPLAPAPNPASKARSGEPPFATQIRETDAHDEPPHGKGTAERLSFLTEARAVEGKAILRSVSWHGERDSPATYVKTEPSLGPFSIGTKPDGSLFGLQRREAELCGEAGSLETGSGGGHLAGLGGGSGSPNHLLPRLRLGFGPRGIEMGGVKREPSLCLEGNGEGSELKFGSIGDGGRVHWSAHGSAHGSGHGVCECYECTVAMQLGAVGGATWRSGSSPAKQEWDQPRLLVRTASQPNSSVYFVSPPAMKRGRSRAKAKAVQKGGGDMGAMAPPPQQFLSPAMAPYASIQMGMAQNDTSNGLLPIQPMGDLRLAMGEGGRDESEQGDMREVVLVRAKRGQATDSHSLAERARREKISMRMKVLLELVPSCGKINGMSSQLEQIIGYVKNLQAENQMLSLKLVSLEQESCNTDGGGSIGPTSLADLTTTTSTTQEGGGEPQASEPTTPGDLSTTRQVDTAVTRHMAASGSTAVEPGDWAQAEIEGCNLRPEESKY